MILRLISAVGLLFLCACSSSEVKEVDDKKELTNEEKNAMWRRQSENWQNEKKLVDQRSSKHNEGVVFATQPNMKPDKEKFDAVMKEAYKGDPDYQYSLAMCYKYGYVVKQDTNKALLWFKKAADQGHKKAERVYKFMVQRK